MRIAMSETGRIASSQLGAKFPVGALQSLRARVLDHPTAPPTAVFGPGDGLSALGRIGIIEHDGVVVELLPKTLEVDGDLEGARQVAKSLIEAYGVQSSARSVGIASVTATKNYLGEQTMARYVAEVDNLIERGLRAKYRAEGVRSSYIRGRIDFAGLSRMPPGRGHVIPQRMSVFSLNRPENRLIKHALNIVALRSSSASLRVLADGLSRRMWDIPPSRDLDRDLISWENSASMGVYQKVEPLLRAVLAGSAGYSSGATQGDAWLWNTHILFESLVSSVVRKLASGAGWQMLTQGVGLADCHLVRSVNGRVMFRLEPDIALLLGKEVSMILDAKWKNVDLPDHSVHRSVREWDGALEKAVLRSDLYQLYSYARHFGASVVGAVYPSTRRFAHPEVIALSGVDLVLLPFDVRGKRFLGRESSKVRSSLGTELASVIFP